MTHRLLNLATTVSLLLFGAVLVLWVRSYRGCDALVRPAGAGQRLCVTSEFGLLVFEREGPVRGTVLDGWQYFPSPLPRRWPVASGPVPRVPAAYSGLVTHFVRLPPSTVHGVAVPHWVAMTAFSVLPSQLLRRRRSRGVSTRRAKAGLCTRCGYDLRASPLRCPECGGQAPPPVARPVQTRA